MVRHLLVTAALAAVAPALVGACDAQVVENCVTGPCSLPGAGSNGSTTSSSSSSSASSSGMGAGGGDAGTGDAGDAGPPLDAKNCPTNLDRTGDIPCDIFNEVIHPICNQCHTCPTKNGAPFEILNYADTQMPYDGLRNCTTDADCGPTPVNCVASVCKGLRFQQMFISTSPAGCPRMPFDQDALWMVPGQATYDRFHDWLGSCALPVPAGTGCGLPAGGCN